ncbi:hypothetical protein PUG81_27755 [Erwiniaceae bacterium L1_54_6]|nr:hypothetical protein [Erwiniaceae bacterium L1_54_6]
MDATRILTSVFSAMGKLFDYCLNRKLLQRQAAEAASRLISVLDRYVRDCSAAASDDGYLPGANPSTMTTVTEKNNVQIRFWLSLTFRAGTFYHFVTQTECGTSNTGRMILQTFYRKHLRGFRCPG